MRAQSYDGRDVAVFERTHAQRPGTRIAVVVGIDTYRHLPRLEYAEKDATDLAAMLQTMGFAVRSLRMDTETSPHHAATILTAVEEVCAQADPSDTVLVFLSGHGFSVAEGREPYFCAHYTDPEKLVSTGVALDEVRRRLVHSKARQKMLIVDACRNVPSRGVTDTLELGDQFQSEGIGILFSTSPGSRSYEPRGLERDGKDRPIQNGIFTHFLLRGLEGDADSNGDQFVSFHEVAYYVWGQVKGQTGYQQKPFMLWDGDAGGDIALRLLSRATPAVARPVAASASRTKLAAWAEVVTEVPDPAIVDSQWRDRIVATGLPWRVQHRQTGIRMVLVPPGEFAMGSPTTEKGHLAEERLHQRQIGRAFYLGEGEVTQRQWLAAMGDNPSSFQDLECPVEQVSWLEASAFVQQVGLRLPSEAEWEYACRAGSESAFASGVDLLPSIAHAEGRRRGTVPARSLRANALGLHDMHGNVWEWCMDTYAEYPATGGQVPSIRAGIDERVLRGGSWGSFASSCRSAFRHRLPASSRNMQAGFRVAKDAE